MSIKQEDQCFFVPAYNKKFVEKARTVLADSVVFDLEAILQEQREIARNIVKEVYTEKGPKFGDSERVLRVNFIGGEDFQKDMQLASEIEIDANFIF